MHFIEPTTTLFTGINYSSPTTPSSQNSSGKTWANIAAGNNRSASLIDFPRQSVSGIFLYYVLKD